MNRPEAEYRVDIASPAAPNGLESAGLETSVNPTETNIITQNARGIIFFGWVRDGIRRFADYTGEVGRKISPKNLITLGQIGLASLAIACGGQTEANASTIAIDTPAPVATGQKIAETSAPTVVVAPAPEVKVAAPVAVATEAPKAVVITGPTEASKAKVRDESPVKLTAISSEISSIQLPSNVSLTPEGLKRVQGDVASNTKIAQESLANGNIETARDALLRLKDNIRSLTKSGTTVIIPKELKVKHDPADKYVKGDLVLDSGLLDYYFSVVDILVATDSSYPSGSK